MYLQRIGLNSLAYTLLCTAGTGDYQVTLSFAVNDSGILDTIARLSKSKKLIIYSCLCVLNQ